MSIKLYANSNILVIGATGSGKTMAVLKIIKEKLIAPMPEKIFYMYAVRQPFMDEWERDRQNPKIDFIEGLHLDVLKQYDGPKLLVCDDLILSVSKELVNHFIAGSHHTQTTTIFITHSIFSKNEFYKLMSLNSQYIMLFKNKRNTAQVHTLARQILKTDHHRLVEGYKYISAFNFVLLSFHPKVPDELLVTADFFSKWLSVFL